MARTFPTALAREQTKSRQGNAIQEAARRQSQAANQCPIVNGLLVGPVTLAAGVAKDIPHGLGRPWRGWFDVSRTNVPAWGESTQTDRAKFLSLLSTVDATVTFWVF